MQTPNTDQTVERRAGDGNHPGGSVGATPAAAASPRAVCSALNRAIIAGRDEIMVLDAAAGIMDDAERRARLREQAGRRVIFQQDLVAAVRALGGAPAQHAPSSARLMAGVRRVRRLLIGPHAGDAYAVCARAAAKSASAYSRALELRLPADVRYGVERQSAEVENDCSELRRLRWGANPSTLPRERGETMLAGAGRDAARLRTELDDERALEEWTEDGGAGPNRSVVADTPPGFSSASH